MCENAMIQRSGDFKSPIVYGKTFDFVKRICVKADGTLGLLLIPCFMPYVSVNK